jgi:hypothetical protein
MHLLYQQLGYFQEGSAASYDDALNAAFIQEIDQNWAAARMNRSLSRTGHPRKHRKIQKSS